ncbi:MAG TPA: hypothetical protein ENM97_00200 [Moorella mulderi]|nr:hypothetical protein [Moorella mulderi]
MENKRRRSLFLGAACLLILLAGLGLFQMARGRGTPISPPATAEDPGRKPPLVLRRYLADGRSEEVPWPSDLPWENLDKEKLARYFSPTEGWRIVEDEKRRLVLIQEVPGLPPQEATKRHLKIKDGFVAIYQGSAGSPGPLLRVTPIPASALPSSWREKIEKGEAEFSSEEELLVALDSLDEFSPPLKKKGIELHVANIP